MLAGRHLIRLAIVHCFRNVVRKPGNSFVGSVIRFPPMAWCSSQRVFHTSCISKFVLSVL